MDEIFQRDDSTGQTYVVVYHVYDNLSRTPNRPRIECEDPAEYTMNAWHVITPETLMRHLNFAGRRRHRFTSLYANMNDAIREADRRRNQILVPNVGWRQPDSVRIERVCLPYNRDVWFFSRAEMMALGA